MFTVAKYFMLFFVYFSLLLSTHAIILLDKFLLVFSHFCLLIAPSYLVDPINMHPLI